MRCNTNISVCVLRSAVHLLPAVDHRQHTQTAIHARNIIALCKSTTLPGAVVGATTGNNFTANYDDHSWNYDVEHISGLTIRVCKCDRNWSNRRNLFGSHLSCCSWLWAARVALSLSCTKRVRVDISLTGLCESCRGTAHTKPTT